ncbi:hypothetical protein AXF42_Ash017869 [Apostasia shenzhenica]|uniref:Retrotransposon gag domain-containing protein n=1 Tax=Apostasia shenzhenica TaxID=1088818 RepID=A0A2I0AY36_9ASPA|nr:hypothetical protein AXF42_Ash017869 [Apostasia shenzhenica]
MTFDGNEQRPADESSSHHEGRGKAPVYNDEQMRRVLTSLAYIMENASNTMNGGGGFSCQADRYAESFQRMHSKRFSGTTNPIEAENWLDHIERILDEIAFPLDRRVPLTVLVLDDDASNWWKSQKRLRFNDRPPTDISWAEFCIAFRDWFVPESARNKMRNELNHLGQRDMTITEYESKFSALARYVPDLVSTKEQKCYHFRKGLRDSIREILGPYRYKDFADLVEALRGSRAGTRDYTEEKRGWQKKGIIFTEWRIIFTEWRIIFTERRIISKEIYNW